MLTRVQNDCFDAILRLRRSGMPGPGLRAIAAEMGMKSHGGLEETVDRLVERGRLLKISLEFGCDLIPIVHFPPPGGEVVP